MSDRPTPETDAITSVGLENADRECVPADFARKLEQERDEARVAIRALAEHGESEIQRITKERDEAREALASREVVIAQQNVITDLILEREEARAVASELSDIAHKYLSFLLAITPTKSNEKHEKETEKVIDALKRRKKL